MTTTKKHIVIRFAIVYVIIAVAFLGIVGKIVQIQYFEGDQWREVNRQNTRDSIVVPASRGNIYSAEGKLMAGSIPYYKLYMDFNIPPYTVHRKDEKGKFVLDAKGKRITDTIHYKDEIYKYVDSLSICLSNKFGDRNASQYRNDILNAFNQKRKNGRRNGRYLLYPKEVSYIDLQEIKQFPFLKKGQYKSGFYTEDRLKRVRPFGSLASRTIGDIYGSNGRGRSGLEMTYQDILTGTNGIATRQRIGGERISINQIEPVDGIDIITTINVEMQDIAEQALREKLEAIGATEGCVVLMEVKTGEIKAIANLVRRSDGTYHEDKNMAFGYTTEPGSTFKVASMIVALENNVVKPSDTIDTKKGIHYFGSTAMKDHNWDKGGYGRISASDAIKYSSNIGIARIINENFADKPEKFVNGLHGMKLNQRIDFEIPGHGAPNIPHPNDQTAWQKGDKTKLPWMSIGYNTQIPPIHTLMFYNAIANDGKMIKPFLVKNFRQDGEIIKTFKTEVINSSICSNNTLGKIRPMLEAVVESGTAKDAQSDAFKIAGKTGTAQLGYGKKGEKLKHQVSFCGYFPADAPMYSCIVVVWEPKGIPSGGRMAGTVFKEIAEKVYARNAISPIVSNDAIKNPVSKNGDFKELKNVFSILNIATDERMTGNHRWAKTSASEENVTISPLAVNDKMPDVTGMGAKDAVYLIENSGKKVARIIGSGTVKTQTANGNNVTLTLR